MAKAKRMSEEEMLKLLKLDPESIAERERRMERPRSLDHIQEQRAAVMARFQKAFEVLSDVETLKAMHEEHEKAYLAALHRVGGDLPAYGPSRPVSSLQTFVRMAEEFVTLLYAEIAGLPTSNACICPTCKTILLKSPTKGYYCGDCHCSWDVQGRYHKGLDFNFWNRYLPGDKFRGLLETDLQEEMDGRSKRGASGMAPDGG